RSLAHFIVPVPIALGVIQSAASAQRAHASPDSARTLLADQRRVPAAPVTTSPLERIISLTLDRVRLGEALDELARHADVRIAYSQRVVPLGRRISVNLTAVPVQAALERLLRGTGAVARLEPTGQILIVPGHTESTGRAPRMQGSIRGTVRAAQSAAPLEGVVVSLAGTRYGAVSRADGRYAIAGVPVGTYRIEARRLGYSQRDTSAVVAEEQEVVVDLVMQAVATPLDAVVTIGYGTTTRRDLTGAVATITEEDFRTKAAPLVTLTNALQSRAAGLQVITNSGMPGAGARVRVRGTGSITANSEPLYVIDGLPAVQGSQSGDPKDNPLMSLDMSDIESIEILKDASSTAIYGARGANGVVLVTTRRGRRGEHSVSVESSYGQQQISKEIDVLGGAEYMTLANEARAAANLSALFTPAQIAAAQTFNYPEMMLRTAAQHTHALSVRGGDQRFRYLFGGNYTSQDGIAIGSDFERYGGRLNMDSDVSSRFRVGASLSGTRVARTANAVENGSLGNSSNGLLAALIFAPFQAPRDTNGAWVRTSPTTEPVPNPVANASELKDLNTTWRLLGSAKAEYDFTPNLVFSTQAGGNFQFDRVNFYAPRTILAGGVGGNALLVSDETRDLTSETQLRYNRGAFGPGSLDLLGGFSAQTFYFERVGGQGQNFPTDATEEFSLGSGAQLVPSISGLNESAIMSFYGRANYNIRGKYLFTINTRYDGSSKFGRNNKWALFPSGAAAWRISDEDFMRRFAGVSDLKLRLSYGQVGNQAVLSYQSLSALGTAWYAFGGTEVPALAPGGAMPNPNLKWEQKTELNVGVDAGFLRDRITLTLDVYSAKTEDLLLSVSLPSTTGFNSQLRNIGSMKNKGVELSLSTVNVERSDFQWRTTFNIAGNRNKVVDMGLQDSLLIGARGAGFFNPGQTHILKEGKPIGSIYGFHVLGLWQTGDACFLRGAVNCTPGEYKIRDVNGDSAITAADRVILGNGDPKYYGGLSNSFAYKRFTLDAFVNFVQGNKVINAGAAYGCLAIGQANERDCVLNRWTPNNTNTTVPRANISRPRRLYSTLVEDGSYIRLQTLTLGYQLPAALLRGTQSARLFLTGQNLWISTDYTGFDPDVNSMGGDARFGGTDIGAYPRTRTWNLGAAVTF
ncbi:MAG TPA: SusC/RagA family TonB-linked outer membrane protein, partial [Gemmatimonadaceae bacterium]|nr:SusC/RagA family TonB-linked outer membrane protein [Gemmatimonadaceae bacterium]